MKQITFCINTCRNERNHIELLFRSLKRNLSDKNHHIIVYIENDNQDTLGFLKTQKQYFENLKIIKNPLSVPLDYARNLNIMFNMAETEIVSYLQSDMVICPNYDEEILKYISPDTIISSTRVEPPLHPPSIEKITSDFGLDPNKFDLDRFSDFSQNNKKNVVTDYWFAPFTFYKKIWNDIGGHDTLFRRSRVDSDILYRFCLNKINVKQVWNAIVYHFTCTSSRGIEWWTEKSRERTNLQTIADNIELVKFVRKWGTFKHPCNPNEVANDYFYKISANLYNVNPSDVSILKYHFMFDKIYIDNTDNQILTKKLYDELQTPANQLHNISNDEWNSHKKYYRVLEYEDIFEKDQIKSAEVILNINLNNQPFESISNINPLKYRQQLVHEYRFENSGEFKIDEYTNISMVLNSPTNRIMENLKIENPLIDEIKFIIQ